MNSEYNELLNKYIDNELTDKEIESVNEIALEDDKFSTALKTHNFVHNSLLDMKLKYTSAGFTEMVMGKIVKKLGEKYKKNYLFRGVMSVLGFILVLSLFLFFSYIGDLALVKSATTSSDSIFDKIIPTVSYFSQIVNTDIFKTITGLLGFIVLLVFYFNLNSHKSMKEKLEQL